MPLDPLIRWAARKKRINLLLDRAPPGLIASSNASILARCSAASSKHLVGLHVCNACLPCPPMPASAADHFLDHFDELLRVEGRPPTGRSRGAPGLHHCRTIRWSASGSARCGTGASPAASVLMGQAVHARHVLVGQRRLKLLPFAFSGHPSHRRLRPLRSQRFSGWNDTHLCADGAQNHQR